MVFVKNCKFSQVFFLVKICQINCLVTFYIEKQAFQTIETLITKSRKICIFPKGPWFFSKIVIFLIFSFYLKNGEQKSLMTFYIGKQAFLDYKNMVLNKSQYCIFQSCQSMCFVKNCNFAYSFFKVKIGRVKVFGDVLD